MPAATTGAGRLALGTAQLGRPYGVANQTGRPSRGEASAILDLAVGAGVRSFDTAAGYGDAELRIGDYLRSRSLRQRVQVITKIGVADVGEELSACAALARSRARLGVAPGAVLLHDPELMADWRGALGESLKAARAEGSAGAIGVSVYHPDQFAQALELPELDVIQAPCNVFDQRLQQAGLIEEANRSGILVMLRSVFLQGLLLLDPRRCPPPLAFAAPRLRRWRELCGAHGVDPAVVALRFVLQRTAFTTVVVGCESPAQLQQLLAAADAPDLPCELLAELDDLATSDTDLIDPTRWRIGPSG